MKTRTERSAGGVVFRPAGDDGNGDVEIALASRRTRKGDLAWGLPKGLIEPAEQPEDAALREVREETGLDAEIEDDLGWISYFYVWEGERVRKSVRFFLMRATGGDISLHDHEMEEVRWFPLDDAVRTATYPSETGVLRKAAGLLRTSR
ncbi:MAG TPA: NUDIX hydrolase [Actinomycetota bacterium]